MKSMTGYGKGEASNESRKVTIEIKSVNNRFLDINTRFPKSLSYVEDTVKKQIQEVVKRGTLDVYYTYEVTGDTDKVVEADIPLAGEYLAAMRTVKDELGLPDDITAMSILRMPDVLTVTAALIVGGTLLIKATEDVSWLGALFFSVSSRTAGFSTYNLGAFSSAGLFTITILMFIGASPGSTGGGIKTTTFFTLLQGIKASATNRAEKAFRYSMPHDAFKKASVITLIALGVVIIGTYLMMVMEANTDIRLVDALFEVVSAFGTVGLSTGITPDLTVGSKILSILIMYIGRLGPMTIATLWHFTRGDRVFYPTGNISIG